MISLASVDLDIYSDEPETESQPQAKGFGVSFLRYFLCDSLSLFLPNDET